MIIPTTMQQRRDTSTNWASANPVLAAGEIGIETDTNKMKVGNGSSAWNNLSYISGSITVDTDLSASSANPIANMTVYTALSNKQDKLTSGTNIKTINGESLLGSGDITIESSIFEDVEELPEVSSADLTKVYRVPKYGLSVTTVPNTGTVGKVYFNTNLSDAKVESLLSKLTYAEKLDYTNNWLVAADESNAIAAMREEGAYGILNGITQKVYWVNQTAVDLIGANLGITTAGWQTFDNPIEINAEVIADPVGDGSVIIGAENNLIKELFYTEPIVEDALIGYSYYRVIGSEWVEILGEADLNAYEKTKLIINVPAPTGGAISDFTFTDEQINAIKNNEVILRFFDSNQEYHIPCIGRLTLEGFEVVYYGAIIMYNLFQTQNVFYIINLSTKTIVGSYRKDAITSVDLKLWEVKNNYDDPAIQIDLWNGETVASTLQLGEAIIGTPSDSSSTATLNGLKNYVDENNSFIDVETLPEASSADLTKVYRVPEYDWAGTEVPSSGTIESLYFNTSLTNNEVYHIIDTVTWIDAANLGQSGFKFYPVLAYMNGSYPYVLAFKKYTTFSGKHSEGDINGAIINFATMATVTDFYISCDDGWESFNNPYPINATALSELSGIPIGTENDKLKKLISTTFIEKTGALLGYKYYRVINGEWVEVLQGKENYIIDITSESFNNGTISFTDEEWDIIVNQPNVVIRIRPSIIDTANPAEWLLEKSFSASLNNNAAVIFYGAHNFLTTSIGILSVILQKENGQYYITQSNVVFDSLLTTDKTTTTIDTSSKLPTSNAVKTYVDENKPFVDVEELPENPDSQKIYRVSTPELQWYMYAEGELINFSEMMGANGATLNIIQASELPEDFEPLLNDETFTITLYVIGEDIYGYDNLTGSNTWLSNNELITLIELGAGYGGFITSLDTTNLTDGYHYLYPVTFHSYINVNGDLQFEFANLSELENNLGVGREGTGINSEVFNNYAENVASGDYSHAEGDFTTASGYNSHAEGAYTTASESGAHAEGSYTTASGYASHAEGWYTTASGSDSHAEGSNTTASGSDSHAEGFNTTASGQTSHAEGTNTTASGRYSHAEGTNTTASGQTSHAEGYYTKASSANQHVQGKYNIQDSSETYAHIVGNGSSSARSNAHTLDWDGNAWFAGSIRVGGTSWDDATELGGSGNIVDVEELPELIVTIKNAVPNYGTVEKVWFNTSLSTTEVEALLNKLTYIEEGFNIYPLIWSSDSTIQILVIKFNGMITIGDAVTNVTYWVNSTAASTNNIAAGWQSFVNPIMINKEVVSEHNEVHIGAQNNLISELFYIPTTTTVIDSDVELEKIYRVPNYSLGGGTAVPNSGTVGKVYFNTSMSDEKVLSLLNQLPYFESDTTNHIFMTTLLVTSDSSKIYVAQKHYEDIYLQDLASNTLLWSSYDGWQEFTNPIEINAEVVSEMDGVSIGTQNDLIKELFYTEPLLEPTLLGYNYYRVIDGEWVEVMGGGINEEEVNTIIAKYMSDNYGNGDTEEY